jgi:hypothetical protein
LQDVKISPAGIVIALGVVLVVGAFGWLTLGPKPAPPPRPVLTPEARAYLQYLKLSPPRMQAAESYVQSRLIEILGDVTNTGNRNVRLVQVTCVFHDFSGNEVAREPAYVVDGRGGALLPGQTRPFRMPFDTIPESWNQDMPTLVIAQIQFGDQASRK